MNLVSVRACSQSGRIRAASPDVAAFARNMSYSVLPLRYCTSVPPGMKGFPSSSLSTTIASTRFTFGKRRDSSAGLGAETCFGTGVGAGALDFDSQDQRRIAKAATGNVRIPLEYRHAPSRDHPLGRYYFHYVRLCRGSSKTH